jgi:hypothetical protein
MKHIYAAVVLATVVRSVCGAAVTVRPESVQFPGGAGDRIVTLDVYAFNPDASENERLNGFAIVLEAPNFSPTGVRFLIPPVDPRLGSILIDMPSQAHPYVFADYRGMGPVDPALMSDYNTVLAYDALPRAGQEADLSEARNGFARVNVLVPAGSPAGDYPIFLDPELTMLGSAGPNIPIVLGFGGLFLPEPGAAGLLLVASPAVMRRGRRRRAA